MCNLSLNATMGNESQVKREVKKILKAAGVFYFMPAANGYGAIGVADFICVHQGNFVAIETKFGNNKQTANQIRFQKSVEQAGGVYLLINETNVNKLVEYL